MKKFITQLLIVSILATSSFVVLPKTTIADTTTNLVAHWNFDEASGNALDSSGNSNTGTLNNSPTRVAGKIGSGAISFNGTNQYISASDSASLDFGDVFTYAVWFKRGRSTHTTYEILMSKGPNSPVLLISGQDAVSGTTNTVGFWKHSGTKLAESSVLVNDTNWHHAVATKNGSTIKLYIDGVDVTTAVGSNTTFSGTGPFHIATESTVPREYFQGTLDDVRVYSRALSSTDVTELYAMGTPAVSVFSKPSLVVLGNLIINSTRKSVVLGNSNSHSHDLESGSSQYLSITDGTQTGLDLTGDFTMEAYINLESSGNNQDLLSKWNASDGHRSYIWRLNPTAGTVELLLSDDGVFLTTDTVSVTLPTSTWIHLAITYDASAGTAEVFKDGVSQGTMTGLDTSIRNGGAPFVIGAQETSTSAGSFFDGLIDEMRIWNVVRTSSEIADNDNEELIGNESGLVAYWKFNNDRTDTTSNNNDLSAVNTPIFSTTVPFANYQGSETEYGGGIFHIY